MFTLGAFAVIFDQNDHVLLCHRTDCDLWNLPGGKLEENELPTDAVVREVKEETGYDVEVKRLSGVYKNSRKNDVVFVFVCSIIGGVPTLSDESDQIEFFDVTNLPKHFSPKSIERIQDVLLNGSEVIFKIQSQPSGKELLEQGLL